MAETPIHLPVFAKEKEDENGAPDCRGYPYLDEPDFAFRTMAMIERTLTCPIVYEVMEELKREVGFGRRQRT